MDDEQEHKDYFSPEAVALRRVDEPPEVTEVWKHARNGGFRHNKTARHWDGKPKKERPDF